MKKNNSDRLNFLLKLYSLDSASAEEVRELFKLIRESKDHDLTDFLEEEWINAGVENGELIRDLDHIYNTVIQEPVSSTGKQLIRYRWSVAAAALILVSFAVYLFVPRPANRQNYAHLHNAIKPGRNTALLTLADGTIINLDSIATGRLANQGNIRILKKTDGVITYDFTKRRLINPHSSSLINHLQTPKGGQYEMILSDGTRVWLNAASDLDFPVAFSGKERVVELRGEAYFEVAHDNHKPFIVNTPNERIEVLGTHFNVNSYTDEPLSKTTLLEGRVAVSINGQAGSGTRVLHPGEEAVTDKKILSVRAADLDKAVAWKNGYFIFHNQDLKMIMREIERWYDVTVVYDGDFSNRRFEGSVSKFKNVSEILRKFELTNSIHFKIEGRRITVTE